jgi:hypothetical protein
MGIAPLLLEIGGDPSPDLGPEMVLDPFRRGMEMIQRQCK